MKSLLFVLVFVLLFVQLLPAQQLEYQSSCLSWLGSGVVSGDYYLRSSAMGLQIINMSDPTNPVVQGRYYLGAMVRGIAVQGNYAYISNDWAGLKVLLFDFR